MKWQNVGSAPCYRPYRVAYRLTSPGGQQQVFVSNITVNKWLPGSIELFTEEFFKAAGRPAARRSCRSAGCDTAAR